MCFNGWPKLFGDSVIPGMHVVTVEFEVLVLHELLNQFQYHDRTIFDTFYDLSDISQIFFFN